MNNEPPHPGSPGWHIDPETLLPVLTDEPTFRSVNADDPALEVLVHLWSGRPGAAEHALKPLLDPGPGSWRLQALAADAIRNRGLTDHAAKIYRALLDRHRYQPPQSTLQHGLGITHYVAGDYASAAACFHEALRLHREDNAAAGLLTTSEDALRAALARIPDPLSDTRAWNWGILFVYDPETGEQPDDVDTDVPVTIGENGIDIKIRHEQDYDWQSGEEGPAKVTLHISRSTSPPMPECRVNVETTLATPSGMLYFGNAESDLLVPTPGEMTRLTISHDDPEWMSPDTVWVNLTQAPT